MTSVCLRLLCGFKIRMDVFFVEKRCCGKLQMLRLIPTDVECLLHRNFLYNKKKKKKKCCEYNVWGISFNLSGSCSLDGMICLYQCAYFILVICLTFFKRTTLEVLCTSSLLLCLLHRQSIWYYYSYLVPLFCIIDLLHPSEINVGKMQLNMKTMI